MSWLEDLTHPIVGRVWMAFLGIGYSFEATICTDEHLEVMVFVSGQDPLQPVESPPHLDVELSVWNKGGPDVSVVSWAPKLTAIYTVNGIPKGHLLLARTGQPIHISMRFDPKEQPLPVKPGDPFELTLNLSNGIPKRFRTKVKAKPPS